MTSEIEKLLKIIEGQLGWGDAAAWQSRDFEILNQLIFEKTKVSLSASTLRRVWGRVQYEHLPSGTTLDALSRFAGFENWRTFLKTNGLLNKTETITVRSKRTPQFGLYLKTLIGLFLIGLSYIFISYLINRRRHDINPGNYSFTSQRLAKGIPNSVIFSYNATASPTDSVYIQQSWDPRTKTLVDKDMHQFTSVYYEPGFYNAKLVVGGKIVKQHKLMIPTAGWLGLIENKPVPLYLKSSDFVSKNTLGLYFGSVWQKSAGMAFHPDIVKYYNVGNFKPVPLTGFSFSALVKNEYSEGSAACQFTQVSLITDVFPIIIPLSARGCVSELNMISINHIISGKTNNLSGFGVDFSDWVLVSCKNTGNKIQYFINNKLAYEAPMPAYKVNIVGMGFTFQGTGAVKNIKLLNNQKTIFSAFPAL
jgi:hypothetical protein